MGNRISYRVPTHDTPIAGLANYISTTTGININDTYVNVMSMVLSSITEYVFIEALHAIIPLGLNTGFFGTDAETDMLVSIEDKLTYINLYFGYEEYGYITNVIRYLYQLFQHELEKMYYTFGNNMFNTNRVTSACGVTVGIEGYDIIISFLLI